MLDTEVQMIKNSGINLELWDRVRVYTGTSEVMARFVPLGGDVLEEGSKGFAQLRLEEEIAVKNYDKFIIRTYSPMITIGGGVILDCNPKKHNRFNDEILNKLKIQSKGSGKDLIANYILLNQQYLVTADKIAKALEKSSELYVKVFNKDEDLFKKHNWSDKDIKRFNYSITCLTDYFSIQQSQLLILVLCERYNVIDPKKPKIKKKILIGFIKSKTKIPKKIFILSPLAYASPARCVSMLCIYLKVPSHLSQATILLRKRDGFRRLSRLIFCAH